MPKRAFSYIRFSTEHQSAGDSLRRQLESTRSYCTRNGLVLDESLELRDLGVSAFKGRNSVKGSLARFIELCERGDIPPGCALVVESLDRISRQKPLRAIALLTQLLDLGIEIHMTMTGQIFRPSSEDETGAQEGMSLMYAVVGLMRANEESETKSRRLREVFARKRERAAAGEVLFSKTVPWWLTIEEDKIVLVPERARIVKQIFEWRKKGWSTQKIARELNSKKVPTFRPRAREWEDSRIRDTLRYDAALGHLTPTSKTKAAGGSSSNYRIENYYPRVISDRLAAEARARTESTDAPRQSHSGRPLNILKGILRHRGRWCRCQSHQNGIPDANGVKTFNTYFDDHDPNNEGKKTWSIAGRALEPVLVHAMRELSPVDLVPDAPGVPRRSTILRRKVNALTDKIARIVDAVEVHGATALTARLTELEKSLVDARRELMRAEAEEGLATPTTSLLRSISVDLSDPNHRAKTAAAIRRLVTRIDVADDIAGLGLDEALATGLHVSLVDALAQARREKTSVIMEDPVPLSKRRKPLAILVHFRGGAYRLIARLPVGLINVRVNKILPRLMESGDPFPPPKGAVTR